MLRIFLSSFTRKVDIDSKILKFRLNIFVERFVYSTYCFCGIQHKEYDSFHSQFHFLFINLILTNKCLLLRKYPYNTGIAFPSLVYIKACLNVLILKAFG